MKDRSKIKNPNKKNRVFARLIGRKLNKIEEKQISGGGNLQGTCYDTYIASGFYLPDCTFN